MFYELAIDTWGEEEIGAIRRVIDNGRYTMGDNVRRFEEAFAAAFGSSYAVMVNSGSSANLVAVAALAHKAENRLVAGDEVIVPAISWSTSYYPLQQYGLRLRFVDVDIETLNMDVSKLERAVTPRTKMVLAVNILGNPCELTRLRRFCDERGLYLFEDNCESMGASLDGKPCGTFGDVGTFSTFFSHHISTMEGGVIVTDDEEIFHLARSLRNHGWTRDLPEGSPIYTKRDDDFFEAYRFILPGYNVRPLELAGAIGLEQLPKLARFVEGRRANAALFRRLFEGDSRFVTQKENGTSSWFAFTLIPDPAARIDRRRLLGALRDADIGFRIITGGCFPRHDVIKYFDYDIVDTLDNANIAHDHGFFVGNGPEDLTPQLTRLRETLDAVVG